MTDETTLPDDDETAEQIAARQAAELAEAERQAREDLEARLANTGYDPETVVRLDDGAIECVLIDKATGKTRPSGMRATAKSPFNRAMFARIEADMGDAIPDKPVPVVPIEDARKAALACVDQLHADQLVMLTGNTTAPERDTWARKLMAARGVLSGTPDQNDELTLTKGAAARGMTITQFSQLVIAKDQAFTALIDEADEFREQGRSAIEACETTEQLDTVIKTLTADMNAVVEAKQTA